MIKLTHSNALSFYLRPTYNYDSKITIIREHIPPSYLYSWTSLSGTRLSRTQIHQFPLETADSKWLRSSFSYLQLAAFSNYFSFPLRIRDSGIQLYNPSILIFLMCINNYITKSFLFTQCVPVPFQGFQRGTYRCTCKRGYYFPDTSASRKYFHGKVLEEEYDKMLRGEVNSYEDDFECLACSDGCEECEDDRACVYSIYTSLRYALLVVNCLVILISLVFAVLVYKYWQNKVKLDIQRVHKA